MYINVCYLDRFSLPESIVPSSASLPDVCDEEDYSEHKTKGTDNDIANCQEVVLASESVCGREDKALLAIVACHVILVVNAHHVGTWLEIFFNSSPKLSEVG
jgi:hypothetical protein